MKKHPLNSAKPGEVWALALDEGDYAYARILHGGCLGIFPAISRGIIPHVALLGTHVPRWFFGFAAPPTEPTEVFCVGMIPFANDDEAWPPPRYIPPDIFKGHYQILERGMRRRVEASQTTGLQRAQMATPDWLRQFVHERRAECVLLPDGDPIAPTTGRPPVKADDRHSTLLEIVFCKVDLPLEWDAVEGSLASALENAGVGEATGGGSGPETCAIDVEVTDVGRGLEIIRRILIQHGCASSTVIHQYHPQHVAHRL